MIGEHWIQQKWPIRSKCQLPRNFWFDILQSNVTLLKKMVHKSDPCGTHQVMDAEMATWFPLLIPMNEECTEYDGFVKILDHIFHIQLSVGNIYDPSTYCLSGDWELRQLLTEMNKNLEEVLHQSKSVSHFLMEFCNVVITSSATLMPSPVQFPRVAPICESSLPVRYEPPWHKDRATIKCIYNNFVDKVKDLQSFWSMMDDMDARVWVLDPPKPRVGDCYRRISMGNNVSVVVIVNPEAPRALPKMEFTGPEKLVTKLCGSLKKNAKKWDASKSICENLESVLECEIPSKSTTTMEDIGCACGICYSFLLDNAIPEKVCENASCSKPFHEGCVYEWMRSLPTVRQNFNMLFGECPYCSEPMSCKIA